MAKVVPTERLVQSSQEILDKSAAASLLVRLLGGIAIWSRASVTTRALFPREYGDLDFATYREHAPKFRSLLQECGYVADKHFNMVNGERRLIFHSSDQAFHLDIFLDKFEMSHRLDLRQRLVVDAVTVPGAELLLTKLQVAEINRKDLIDILILLADHDFAESDGPLTINLTQVTDLLSADWGLYTTVSDNIAKTKAFVTEASMISPHMAERLTAQLAALENRIVASPKSVAWKFRARVGRRVRWFEVPEESLP